MSEIFPHFWSDVETGGLDPDEHEILEIAAVRLDANFDIAMSTSEVEDNVYHRYVLPTRPVPEEAAKINGYSEQRWASVGAVSLEEAMKPLLVMMEGAVPAGQNPIFDKGFIMKGFDKLGWKRPKMDYHLIDVAGIVNPLYLAGMIPGVSLRHTVEFFGLGAQLHGAKADLIHAIQVYKRMMAAIRPVLPGLQRHQMMLTLGRENIALRDEVAELKRQLAASKSPTIHIST